MSLREKQQMNLDTERATQTGMEGRSKSSSKYMLLQVWCGLLTVAMVAMAALFATIKPKSAEDGVSTLNPDNGSQTVHSMASIKSIRSSLSYIQLYTSSSAMDKPSWQEDIPRCVSCSLVLLNDSIHCTQDSLYFIYAQVTFTKRSRENHAKSVTLRKSGTSDRTLVEGTFPHTTEGSVWVAKIVSLKEGDSVTLKITDDFYTENTFWGAYQLH